MALDTKYRPTRFEDVLGQSSTVQILREFVSSGAGFRQSYLFCGPFGSGKTTLGRILARSLLCDNPVNGNPCDKCPSCLSILDNGSSVDFVEVDAATNSGKDNIKRITEQIQYASFSGKRRIYLFDEAHQLSRDALDALLKPMEDCIAGSDDKKLVCIFCTTEPEKMRTTVVSRCAPAFVIRHAPTEEIVKRLSYVCESENLDYDVSALDLIAEHSEAHIRDALKSVEGVSMLGRISRDNVVSYLQLESSSAMMDLIEHIVTQKPAEAMGLAKQLLKSHSPAVLYERMAETSMTLYSFGLGAADLPSWWDRERGEQAALSGYVLVHIGQQFARRPGRVNESTFLCDIAQACTPVTAQPSTITPQIPRTGPTERREFDGKIYKTVEFQASPVVVAGTYLDPRGVNKSKVGQSGDTVRDSNGKTSRTSIRQISPSAFSDHVIQRLLELNDGSEGQKDVGDP